MSDELKMMLWRSPLPQSEPTPEPWWILYKRADFWARCNCQSILLALSSAQRVWSIFASSLSLGRTDKVAAKKNSTLACLTSLDHSQRQTHRIIINCRNSRIYKTFCYIYKKQCVIFFSIYLFSFQFLVTSNLLLFRRESSLPWTLKKVSQRGVGQCMVTFPEENFPSVFFPSCSRGLVGGGQSWGGQRFINLNLCISRYFHVIFVNIFD